MSTESPNKYQIPMLSKAFELLELMSLHPRGISMQSIINNLSLAKTTVYRLLNSLESMGYIAKNIETGHYFLSKQILRLGLAALGEVNIVEQSLPQMKKLRDEVGEVVLLGIPMNNRVSLIEQVSGNHPFTFMLKPGSNFCLHASAPGKIFLAHMSDSELKELLKVYELKRFNDNTITTLPELKKELNIVLESGFAVDAQEEMYGINCVAAPIYDQFGKIKASIWTSGPSGRLLNSDFDTIASKVKRAADVISSNLGYNPNI